MVSALTSGSSGLGSSSGRGTALSSWERYFMHMVPIFTGMNINRSIDPLFNDVTSVSDLGVHGARSEYVRAS